MTLLAALLSAMLWSLCPSSGVTGGPLAHPDSGVSGGPMSVQPNSGVSGGPM